MTKRKGMCSGVIKGEDYLDKDLCLADKRKQGLIKGVYWEEDIKEAVRRLEKEAKRWMLDPEYDLFLETLRQIFGKKLTNG